MNIFYKLKEDSNERFDYTFNNPDNSTENFTNQHKSMIKMLVKIGSHENINQNLFHLYNPETNNYVLTTNELLSSIFINLLIKSKIILILSLE